MSTALDNIAAQIASSGAYQPRHLAQPAMLGTGAASAVPEILTGGSALQALQRSALARQVIEGSIAGEPAGSGVMRLATYTRPAATQAAMGPAAQLALQAGGQAGGLAPLQPIAMGAANAGSGATVANTVGGLGGMAINASTAARAPATAAAAAAAASSAPTQAAAAASLTAKLRAGLTPVLSRGAVMRGAGYAGAGYFAGQLANQLMGEHSGTAWDEAATGALTGAGIGAGIGSVVPGVGTAAGAAIGGGLGGLIGYFGPKNSGETPTNQELARQLQQLDKMATQAGLDGDTRMQLALQLQAGRQTVNSKTAMKQLGAQLQQQVPQLAAQAQQQREAQAQSLAMQAAFAPLLSKYLDRYATTARESQVLMNQVAESLGGGLGDIYRQRGASYVADADQMNAALAAQVLNSPNEQALELQRQLEAQLQQQALARMAASQTGGGAVDLNALLAG